MTSQPPALATSAASPLAATPRAHRPLREGVREQLLELIVSGDVRPGSRLVEADLATKLGTSRVPVREALQDLAKDGWVDLKARHGACVHIMDASEVDDLFDVRAALEAEAARLAALRSSPDQASAIRPLIKRGIALVADEAGAAEANREFHQAICGLSGNGMLISLIGGLGQRVQWCFRQVATVRGLRSWEEHAAILDAVGHGDAIQAAGLMRSHTEATRAAFQSWREAMSQAGD